MNLLSCTRLVRQEPAGQLSPRTKHISTIGAEAAWHFHSLRPHSRTRREPFHMNLTSGAQVFQPCNQKLVHLFLSEDFLDLGGDFGQRNIRGTAVVKLRQKLLVVVAL